MQSDITRQVSASLYEDSSLQEKFFNFVKDPYHSVVESYGLDTTEVLKHVFNARREHRSHYQKLFVPALVLWVGLLVSGISIFTFVAFVISYVLVIIKDINKRDFLKANLSKENYNSNFEYEKSNGELITHFQSRSGGNAVFYSGFSPFVGSGLDQGGWSFVVDIDKGKKIIDGRLTPMPFEETELYDAISAEIEDLKIQNLSISDKVFINGRKIRGNRELLPNILSHPVNNVSKEYIETVMNNDIKDARFYKVIQVIDWEGDLVLSAFFRIQKNEKSLFIENNYYLLPPIGDNLKAIDRVKQYSGVRHAIGWVTRLLLVTIMDTLKSLAHVFGYLNGALSQLFGSDEATEQRKIVKSSPDYDYGAETSLREAVSQIYYSQHFQKLDKEKYFKIIEKRIFNLIGDFLDDKNIDASEFKERESSILNNGVIVTGGNVTGENISVGKGSKISFGKKNEK
jgi:hypothetical protein